ncbi:MAG TPA: COX15/CtaA family protein [Candidatus Micrarchaeaceae archaeon]|nr:COX15/CtaA family protein [Candidatus Micrarchaeaceae archaeon]
MVNRSPGRARVLPILAIVTGALTYCLAILGSTVRVTESGMGCPGWPLCYGQLGPIDHFHSVVEQSHRYLVSLVTVFVILTALAAWRFARQRPEVVWPALSALVIIIIQIILGAITVITHNAPITVALHLLTAMILLGVVWITAVATLVPRAGALGRRLNPRGWRAVGATFLVMISGSLVVDGGASYACPAWPGCTNSGGQPQQLVIIQDIHRLMVLIATILIALFVMHAARHWRSVKGARVVADLVAVLLLAQIAVGGLVATLGAPEALQDLHLALGSATWATVVILAAIGWLAAADAGAANSTDPAEAGLLGGVDPMPPLAQSGTGDH